MFFELDSKDFIYGKDNQILYRVVAKEKFNTVNPYCKGMVKDFATIYPGDVGGYAGSIYCLEDKIGIDVKPWIFPCSLIYTGSILSGASVAYGNTEILNNSVIESGCVISGSLVSGSKIKTSKCICDDNIVLMSCILEKNSDIHDTVIQCDNVNIYLSTLNRCALIGGYGNVRIKNSVINNIKMTSNTEIKDSVIKGTGKFNTFGVNTICDKGKELKGTPQDMLIEYKDNKFYPHKKIWQEIYNGKHHMKGIYTDVCYHPVQKGV